jgi:hypothetical protein
MPIVTFLDDGNDDDTLSTTSTARATIDDDALSPDERRTTLSNNSDSEASPSLATRLAQSADCDFLAWTTAATDVDAAATTSRARMKNTTSRQLTAKTRKSHAERLYTTVKKCIAVSCRRLVPEILVELLFLVFVLNARWWRRRHGPRTVHERQNARADLSTRLCHLRLIPQLSVYTMSLSRTVRLVFNVPKNPQPQQPPNTHRRLHHL